MAAAVGETTFFCHPAATVEREEAEDGSLTHSFSSNLPALPQLKRGIPPLKLISFPQFSGISFVFTDLDIHRVNRARASNDRNISKNFN